MNKVLLPLFLLISGFVFGQGQPCPNYQQFGSATTRTAILGLAQGQKGVTVGRYADTTTANSSGCADYYPGTLIVTDSPLDVLWQRNSTATEWINRGSGGIDSITFITDSSIVICFASGSCDTVPINNFTTIVNNIVQNFVDSSVYNINDSTLIFCVGEGNARVCDTINLNNSNNYYTFISGDTTYVVTCDTLQTICIGDSCYLQQVCDTIPIPGISPQTIYQIGVWKHDNIVEWGVPDPNLNTSANIPSHRYILGGPLHFLATAGEATFTIYQNQLADVTPEISNWQHRGSFRPGWGLLDSTTTVKVNLNYTDPLNIPTQGVLAGDTVGYFGNKYGYFLGVNFPLVSNTSKQTGIFFDTHTSSSTQGVGLYAQQTPASYSFTSSGDKDSTFLSKIVLWANTDQSIQLPDYTTTRHRVSDSTNYKPLVIDADGNIYRSFWFGSGGGTLTAANNGTSLSSTTVQLGQTVGAVGNPGILLHHTEIPSGDFTLSFNASATQSNNILQSKNAAAAIRARITSAASFSNTGGQTNSEVFGDNSTVTGVNSSVFGYQATSSVTGGVALGYLANASGIRGIAIGSQATAFGGIAIGSAASSGGATNTAIDGVIVGSATVLVGAGTQGTGSGNIGIGQTVIITANNTISIGYGSSATGSGSTIVGTGGTTAHNSSILLGFSTTTTAANQFIVGGSDLGTNFGIKEVYIGGGVTTPDPQDVFIAISGSEGTDINGTLFTLQGAKGTGTGNPGPLKIQTSVPGSTGTTLQTLGDRYAIVGKYTTLTEATATAFARVNVPTGTVAGGEVIVTIEANDATDFQARTLTFAWTAANKAGTTDADISTPVEVVSISSGTLTVTITVVDAGSGNIDFKADATSSLTQTVLRANCQVLKNFGTGAITAQ